MPEPRKPLLRWPSYTLWVLQYVTESSYQDSDSHGQVCVSHSNNTCFPELLQRLALSRCLCCLNPCLQLQLNGYTACTRLTRMQVSFGARTVYALFPISLNITHYPAQTRHAAHVHHLVGRTLSVAGLEVFLLNISKKTR